MRLDHYFENPQRQKQMKYTFILLLILLLVADFFVPKEHATLPGESIPGFYAVFGFLAALIILGVSKFLGFLFISKKENYYDD